MGSMGILPVSVHESIIVLEQNLAHNDTCHKRTKLQNGASIIIVLLENLTLRCYAFD